MQHQIVRMMTPDGHLVDMVVLPKRDFIRQVRKNKKKMYRKINKKLELANIQSDEPNCLVEGLIIGAIAGALLL